MTASEVWFDAVARACATIEGLSYVHAAGTGGQGTTVRMMPRALGETPAGILVYRGASVLVETAGSYRLTHTIELRIYKAQDDLGEAFGLLMKFPARVLAALPQRAAAYLTLQSLIVSNFEEVVAEQWPAPSQENPNPPWYLVLPVSLQAKETALVTNVPA